MCYLRMSLRIVMTSRPGGFSRTWLDLCTHVYTREEMCNTARQSRALGTLPDSCCVVAQVHILPLDADQQESVAKSRLRQPQHLHMFKQLMGRPDLQQLAANPLVLSMFISHIRLATKPTPIGFASPGILNRWTLYQAAMSTMLTRLDAKTLEARKGQAGRSSNVYLSLLQAIAFHAHCRQTKDLNIEVR